MLCGHPKPKEFTVSGIEYRNVKVERPGGNKLSHFSIQVHDLRFNQTKWRWKLLATGCLNKYMERQRTLQSMKSNQQKSGGEGVSPRGAFFSNITAEERNFAMTDALTDETGYFVVVHIASGSRHHFLPISPTTVKQGAAHCSSFMRLPPKQGIATRLYAPTAKLLAGM